MKISEVSRRYAKALMALVHQKGEQGRAYKDLLAIQQIFAENTSIVAYFTNPLISAEQKTSVVKATLANKGLLEEVYNLLLLLVDKNRMGAFAEIVGAYQQQMDLEQGITRGAVKSAKPLSDEAKKELENKIHKILNKKIILTYEEDPKLLGSIVAQVGGWTFDDSIEAHLIKLNEDLHRRAN